MTASPAHQAPSIEIGQETCFSRDQLYFILSALPDPCFVLTRSGRYAALFGGKDTRYYHDGSNLVGKSVHDVLVFEKAHRFVREIEKALASRSLHIVEYSLSGSDVKGLEADGPDHAIWFEGRVQALDFQVDGEDAVVWVASNITEKNAVENQLRHQSETDALTGFFNRRKLMDVLALKFELFREEHIPSSVFMFDIDHFKTVNDELGHAMGDAVLKAIAGVCRQELRKTDFLARLGGDEFVVVMPATRQEHGTVIANRLRQRVATEVRETLGHHATISGGLSEFLPTDASSEDILKRADDGLYRSKRAGRNRVNAV
ncbi:diguanylate cyclase [Rhizobium sp. CF080]|uniref:sensor domain-containing diguanylate cyclase n=1 Tax=Rhizobium sp. (strain CF080) TaxID=1144310 RepID=UPI000271B51C|nr:sensor domain-containing diguanylate cyclase [Rhizobium sp. CF080]EUB96934.1 diguanylate cyclase [Rhizobium sp. CF080]